MTGATRIREHRQRRREGLRVVPLEVRDTEVAALVERGLLQPAETGNRVAIARALGVLLDELPPEIWRGHALSRPTLAYQPWKPRR